MMSWGGGEAGVLKAGHRGHQGVWLQLPMELRVLYIDSNGPFMAKTPIN